MRRSMIGVLATVIVVAIVTVIGAGVGGASQGRREGRTLVVVQSPPVQQFVDQGDPGPSPGDLIIVASTLSNEAGEQIGDLHVSCAQNFDQIAVCLGIFDLVGRGKLSVDASPVFPNPTVGMVTGGTGEFQNARGEAHIDPQVDGTTRITFHLFG